MFYESPRFPDCIAFGATGGPAFFTEVVGMASGFEQRNQIWEFGRLSWDVSHGVRDDSDMQLLIAYFRSMKGRLHGFRFKDHTDYKVPDQGGAGVIVPAGDGSNPNLWQLAKRYAPESGAAFDLRLIRKPVDGTVHVYKDGVEVIAGMSLDSATGELELATPPAGAEVWSWVGEFDVPVRFDIDKMSIGIVNKTGTGALLEDWQQIPVIELRTDDDAD